MVILRARDGYHLFQICIGNENQILYSLSRLKPAAVNATHSIVESKVFRSDWLFGLGRPLLSVRELTQLAIHVYRERGV